MTVYLVLVVVPAVALSIGLAIGAPEYLYFAVVPIAASAIGLAIGAAADLYYAKDWGKQRQAKTDRQTGKGEKHELDQGRPKSNI